LFFLGGTRTVLHNRGVYNKNNIGNQARDDALLPTYRCSGTEAGHVIGSSENPQKRTSLAGGSMHSFVQPRDCPFTLGAGEERTRRELGFLPENTCPDSEKIDRSVDQSINPRNKRPDFGSGIFRRHATHHFPSIAPVFFRQGWLADRRPFRSSPNRKSDHFGRGTTTQRPSPLRRTRCLGDDRFVRSRPRIVHPDVPIIVPTVLRHRSWPRPRRVTIGVVGVAVRSFFGEGITTTPSPPRVVRTTRDDPARPPWKKQSSDALWQQLSREQVTVGAAAACPNFVVSPEDDQNQNQNQHTARILVHSGKMLYSAVVGERFCFAALSISVLLLELLINGCGVLLLLIAAKHSVQTSVGSFLFSRCAPIRTNNNY